MVRSPTMESPMPGLHVPTSMVDRELDALIEQSRIQRMKLLQAPANCLAALERRASK